MEAVDGLGKNAGASGFTHAARTAEQVGMSQFPVPDGVLQRSGQSRLPHHRVEGHRAIFTCRNDIVFHEIFIYLRKGSAFLGKTH